MNDSITSIFSDAQRKTMPTAMQAVLDMGKKKLSSEQIEKVAGDFESMFISQMLQTLFPEQEEVASMGEEDELFGNVNGDAAYQGMLADEYAKQIARSGGIGIAGFIQREMLKQQEVSVPKTEASDTANGVTI